MDLCDFKQTHVSLLDCLVLKLFHDFPGLVDFTVLKYPVFPVLDIHILPMLDIPMLLILHILVFPILGISTFFRNESSI